MGTIPGFNKIIETSSKGQDPTQDESQKGGSGKGSQGFGGKHLENYGDGFRDRRTEEELLKYPRRIKSIKLPEGCLKEGNEHGIQFEEDKASKYPLEEYKNKVDTNIVALADKDRLKKTLYQYKKIPRSKGGLRDDGFWVYGMDMGNKFKCGVTNESGISRASHIKPVLSTSKKFLLKNYRPFKETPPALTDGGIKIYNPKNIIQQMTQQNCNPSNPSNPNDNPLGNNPKKEDIKPISPTGIDITIPGSTIVTGKQIGRAHV